VRDVAAHLTLQQLGPGATLGMMFRWQGSLDRTIQHVARLRAVTLTTRQIIAEIRGMIGSRRHTLGVTYLETLTDILVHSQDIALPLGRRLGMPPEAAAVAASRVLSMRWPPPLPSARKMAGVRLSATQPADSAALGLVELAGHADTIMVGNGPDPVGGHPRHSPKLSLPSGNVGLRRSAWVETVIPLRRPASHANLGL
jgi:hypothetical protein